MVFEVIRKREILVDKEELARKLHSQYSKGYEDGKSVLDRVREEIENIAKVNFMRSEAVISIDSILEIIDKYRESEGEE